jgi:hypothetical protein
VTASTGFLARSVINVSKKRGSIRITKGDTYMKMVVTAAVLFAGLSAVPAVASPLATSPEATAGMMTDMSSGRIARGQLKTIVPAKREVRRLVRIKR